MKLHADDVPQAAFAMRSDAVEEVSESSVDNDNASNFLSLFCLLDF